MQEALARAWERLDRGGERDRGHRALPDRVLALDPRTLTQRRELSVPTTDPIDHVAPALPPIPGPGYVKCAC